MRVSGHHPVPSLRMCLTLVGAHIAAGRRSRRACRQTAAQQYAVAVHPLEVRQEDRRQPEVRQACQEEARQWWQHPPEDLQPSRPEADHPLLAVDLA